MLSERIFTSYIKPTTIFYFENKNLKIYPNLYSNRLKYNLKAQKFRLCLVDRKY